MKYLFILLTTALLSLSLSACSSSGNLLSSAVSNLSSDPSSFSNQCKRAGGRWANGGVLGLFGCLKTSKDAGKVCSDDKQCEYDCLASRKNPPSPGQPATGMCQATNNYKGCRIEIKNGIAQPEFCITI